MTPRVYISFLTIVACLTYTFSYGQRIKEKHLSFDTSKIAMISLNGNSFWFHPFDTSYKPASLTSSEIKTIDSMLIVAVNTYNDSLPSKHKTWNIDLNKVNYRKQLVTVTNNKGEKEVYVNCFCSTIDDYWKNRWKTEIFVVEDGAQCFFRFKINLSTMTVYSFGINGFG